MAASGIAMQAALGEAGPPAAHHRAEGEQALGKVVPPPATAVVAAAGRDATPAAAPPQPSPIAALPPSPFSSEAAGPLPPFKQELEAPQAKPAAPPADKAAEDIFGVGVSAAAAAAAGFEAQQECVAEGPEYGIQQTDNSVLHGEEERLRALRMLGVLQQPVGHQFGSITSLLKLVFDVPVAQAFLIEEDASIGVPNSPEERWVPYPRCTSHCRYIFEPTHHEMLIVEDLTQDMRFKHNPWVLNPPGFRFYAASPLVSTDGGHRYGTLCVIDFRPRHFSAQQYQMLAHLAEVAVRELVSSCMLHWSQMKLDEAQRAVHKLVRGLDCFSEGILLCDVEGGWGVRYANSAFTRLTGLARQQAVGSPLWSLFGLPAGGATAADVQRALRGRQPFTVSIGLLPSSSSGPSGAASSTPLLMSPASSTDVAPPNSPPGSMLMSSPTVPAGSSDPQLETAGLFTATFTPASSPEFRPDEPAISIPIVPPPPGLARSSSGSSSGLEERSWFVTLQRPAGPQQGSMDSASGTHGSATVTAGAGPANPISYLRPDNMADVQLGPLLGVGASGRAYRGSWHATEVCVKILNLFAPLSPTGASSDAGFPAAPLLEAALSKALLHPNIVPTHAWGISEGVINARGQHHSQVWIVQSLCTLGTLAHARDRGLFQDPATQGPDLRAILLTMRDVAAALSYLHSVGVVHGDLSGNNVLLSPSSPDERGFTAMVADFGLSRPEGLSPDAVPRGSFGTVPNMPPELLADDALTPAADSWAFGTLLWELLSGRRAWRGMGPMQIIAAVTLEHRSLTIPPHWPQGIKDLVCGCLNHNPDARPTAEHILDQVQVLLNKGGCMPAEANGGLEDD